MKRLSLLIILAACTFLAEAQRSRPQTLLGDGVEYTSGFGGFMIQIPTIDGEPSSMTGGGGAVLINSRFYFGGYGLGLADDKQVTSGQEEFDVDFNHGGLMFGYVIRPESLVHATVSSMVGWGNISFKQKPLNLGIAQITDNVFVVNPKVAVEVNMTDWFKINAGVGYQFTNGVDNFYYNAGDFDGANFNLSFLFGWFR